MQRNIFRTILLVVSTFAILFGSPSLKVAAENQAQQPTVSVPTVTGTPIGPTITVNLDNDQINVRNGPGTEYDKVGVLIASQTMPALGKSAAGLWILIAYPGVESGTAWVYSPLVTVSDVDALQVVAPPPTPAPLETATIDPTLAAQFVLDTPATRMPTFTAPPPIVMPTFVNESEGGLMDSLPPMGLFITLFGVIGIIGTLVSVTRRR